MKRIVSFLCASALFVPGCSSDDSGPTPPTDSGTGGDTSSEAGGDTGTDAPTDAPSDAPSDGSSDAPSTPTADLQLLTLSDWHGQIDPTSESSKDVPSISTSYGGAPVLRAYFDADRAANPNTLTLTAGDISGATPPISRFGDPALPDGPAVDAMNYVKLDATTFGNHEFDYDTPVLKQLMARANYSYVTTNLGNVIAELGDKPVRNYLMKTVGGVKVAIIGITNEEAPSLIAPGYSHSLTFNDGVAAANAAAADARSAGASVVVVLTHKGAVGLDASSLPIGPATDFASGLAGVDVVLADHTDVVINRVVGSALVVENRSKGRTYGRIKIHVEKGVVTAKTAEVVDPVGTVTYKPVVVGTAQPSSGTCSASSTSPDKCITAGDVCRASDGKCVTPTACTTDADCTTAGFTCVAATGLCRNVVVAADTGFDAAYAGYKANVNKQFDVALGKAVQKLDGTRSDVRTKEVAVGDLVADALLDRYKGAPDNAQIALTNGGGIRDDIPNSYTPAAGSTFVRTCSTTTAPCDVLLGDVYKVLPFGNTVVVRPMSGKIIWQALEHSVGALPAIDGRFLQIAGFKIVAKVSNTPGNRIISVTLDDGTAIPNDDTVTYKVVTNNFTEAGGDGFVMFPSSRTAPPPTRDIMADVVAAFIKAKTAPLDNVTDGRITLNP